MFHDTRESPCVTWFCAIREGMGAHLRVEWLKAERVRQSLSVTMAVYWKVGSFCLEFEYRGGLIRWPFLRSIVDW